MGAESASRFERGRWRGRAAAVLPHLVALYFIYHVLGILVGSVPAPGDALNRTAWRNPSVRSEIDAWTARLNRLGWRVTPAELEDTCYHACRRLVAGQHAALTPFQAYQYHTGTQQAWSMFVAPHRHPSLLHIDVRRAGGAWEPVYVARSDTATWRRGQFDHIRFRSAIFRFAWPQYRAAYADFAAWVADRAADDFPDAAEVRIRFFTFTSLSPEQARARAAPSGAFDHTVTLPLGPRR